MKWVVLAPYIDNDAIDEGSLWGQCQKLQKHQFLILPATYQHDRSRTKSSIRDWIDYAKHAFHGFKMAKREKAGIITCFPQLGILCGLYNFFQIERTKLVCWTFNLGSFKNGLKQALARLSAKYINELVVHASDEVKPYAAYLNMNQNTVNFVHLHKSEIARELQVDNDDPFVLAMGAANRDYDTLVKATESIDIRCVIVAPQRCLTGITFHKNVTVINSASLDECRKLAQRATINITPINNQKTASGQVSVIEAMKIGSCVIATDTIGTRDYIINHENGLLVPEGDPNKLRLEIKNMLHDVNQQKKYAKNAKQFALETLSVESAAKSLNLILSRVENHDS